MGQSALFFRRVVLAGKKAYTVRKMSYLDELGGYRKYHRKNYEKRHQGVRAPYRPAYLLEKLIYHFNHSHTLHCRVYRIYANYFPNVNHLSGQAKGNKAQPVKSRTLTALIGAAG